MLPKALKHLQGGPVADSASLATIDALHFKARVHEKLGQIKEAIQSLQAAHRRRSRTRAMRWSISFASS